MDVDSKIFVNGDKYKVVSKVDGTDAYEQAKQSTDAGGERGKNFMCMGHIPAGEWALNPWLIEARKALSFHDRQSYADLLKKYFEMKPYFKVKNPTRYFNGWGGSL